MPKFPDDFFFGASTSSHQIEGGNYNDWTEWEKKVSGVKAQAARDRHWPDYILNNYPNPLQTENYISGRAADHYNRFKEDFDIAQQLGHNAHRLSIEWSRVEPEQGEFDLKEIQHYKEVIAALRERGIEPFVTLWHWTLPVWLASGSGSAGAGEGGVRHEEFSDLFSRYAETMVEALGDSVKYWITLNEPEMYALNAYGRGIWPPGKRGIISFYKTLAALIEAHQEAYELIKDINKNAQVGVACNMVYFESAGGVVNNLLKWVAERAWNHHFIHHIKNELDFIGLNYYFHNRINYGLNKNKFEKVSDLGWDLYPQGIKNVLLDLKKYEKLIVITENGLADAEDTNRAWWIEESLKAVSEAITEGVDIQGYLHWSLLDNFEWDKGFWPRFGLIEVDYKTMERKIRPSVLEYKKHIQQQII